MTHKERFINAITLKECDKLPHGDQMIHDKLVAEIVNEYYESDEENALAKWMFEPMTDKNFDRHKKARSFLGFDWCSVFPMETMRDAGITKEGHKIFKDIWGSVQITSLESNEIIEKPIANAKEIKNYKFPSIDDFEYGNINRWIADGSFAVCSQLDSGFFKINQLTGFEEYMEYIYFNKSEMHGLMEKFIEFQIALADKLIDLGVDVIWLGNDFCYNAGPFISPALLQEFDFDYTKKLVEHVHSRGVNVVLHCCGNINFTIKQMINMGVDAIHALQPTAGNDIYKYKEEYGKDVCLIGNVDINELMPNGSPYEVDIKVKEMVERLFYDRTGFVLSTTNLLSIDTPVKNAITMHLAAEKYGK
ncbi:MAG: uroporphyrinogen decarboxylase family protein [Christensenellaceae bacterium]